MRDDLEGNLSVYVWLHREQRRSRVRVGRFYGTLAVTKPQAAKFIRDNQLDAHDLQIEFVPMTEPISLSELL